MWQYTTETIINSNKGNLKGGVRFAVYDNKGDEAAKQEDENRFIIDGVNAFVAKNITAAYKTDHKDEVLEVAEITVPTTGYAAGDTLRLKVVLRQEGLVSSIYQNAYLKHNKPLFFEIAAVAGTEAAKKNAEALVKVIKQQLGVSDFKFFTASADNNAVITLTAADCYARFVEISLDKVGAAEGSGEALLGFEDYVNVAKGEVKTHGSEGMGTVRQLIKNLRLPTSAATNPFGADQGGKPIPGGKYTQYLLEYTTDRRHVGGQVMGALDKSITSHVFFIESAVVDDFDKALALVADVTDVTLGDPTVAKTEIGSVE